MEVMPEGRCDEAWKLLLLRELRLEHHLSLLLHRPWNGGPPLRTLKEVYTRPVPKQPKLAPKISCSNNETIVPLQAVIPHRMNTRREYESRYLIFELMATISENGGSAGWLFRNSVLNYWMRVRSQSVSMLPSSAFFFIRIDPWSIVVLMLSARRLRWDDRSRRIRNFLSRSTQIIAFR